MPNSRVACRWLIPSTWQARRIRAYKSTTFIPQAFRSPPGRKARQRSNFAPPRPDYPAASVRDFLSAALTRIAPTRGPPTPPWFNGNRGRSQGAVGRSGRRGGLTDQVRERRDGV